MATSTQTYELITAAWEGNVEAVGSLLPQSDATVQHNRPLRHAVALGHIACMEMLLPASNLTDPFHYDDLIVSAVIHGDARCVDLLLSYPKLDFDPSAQILDFLMQAVSRDKIDVVRTLVPLALPRIYSDERFTYEILKISVLKKNPQMFNELISFSNPQLTLDVLQREGRTDEECLLLIEHLQRVQNERISAALVNSGSTSPLRKM